MIDIEFYGADKSSKAVLQAWKAYLDHLNMASAASEAWATKKQDLLVDLLQKMAAYLGFELHQTDIKRTSYFPRGYGEAEAELLEIRKLLLSILRGHRAFQSTCLALQQAARRQMAASRKPGSYRAGPRTGDLEAVHVRSPNKALQRTGGSRCSPSGR